MASSPASPAKPIRSPSYPSSSLSDAVAHVRKIESLYRQGPLDRVAAAKLIGYSGASGPANQALASLAQFGLVERAGKGELRVTQRARAILHPNSDEEKRQGLRTAAFEPQLFRDIQDRWPGIMPPEDGVVTYLNRQGFNQSAIRPAAKAYLQTLSFLQEAGVTESHSEGAVQPAQADAQQGGGEAIAYGGASVGDLIDYESGGAIANPEPMRVRAVSYDRAWVFVAGSTRGLEMDQVIVRERSEERKERPTLPLPEEKPSKPQDVVPEGYRSETFDADEGTVTISWPAALSRQSVEDMKDWLELLKRRIERRAGEKVE